MKSLKRLLQAAALLALLPAAAHANWCAEYYDNKNLSGSPVFTRLENTIDYNWGTGSPPGVTGLTGGGDNFSVRWTSTVKYTGPQNNKKYTFQVIADDGVRLYVNGTLQIDEWQDQPASTFTWQTANKAKNSTESIVVEYYENSGNSEIRLNWDTPNGTNGDYAVLPTGSTTAGACAVPTATFTESPTRTRTPTPVPPASTATSTFTRSPTRTITVIGSFTRTPTVTRTVIADTPTRTPVPATPTPTPTASKTVWAGLPAAERLNGLEYIPFPLGSSGGTTIHALDVTFSTAAANNIGRNTARWVITLQDMSSGVVAAETRIGPFGVSCTSGYYNPADYDSATTLSIPSRPSNLSTTYAWVNTDIPPTEHFDAVGDPRYVPYQDVVGQPTTKDDLVKGGYNWFYKDINNSSWSDYQAEYVPFLPEASRSRFNGQPNVDVPKLMMLWREGTMLSRSIYNSLSGYSNYYIGLGGEIGGDSSNNLNDGVRCYGGPWNSSSTSYDVDEIIGKDGRAGTENDGAVFVRSGSWYSRPTLGELWPDASYASDWSSSLTGTAQPWGNLRNSQQGGTAYRDEIQDCDLASKFSFDQVKHRVSGNGAATFMNGNNTSGAFDHTTNEYDAPIMADGTTMATDFNFAMPATFLVNRSWTLDGTNQPDPWTEQPYTGRRTKLEVYAVGLYDASGGGAAKRAAATIRATNIGLDGGGNTATGFFLVNGLKPSTESGINFVARFSMLGVLRTFLDAGAPTTTSTVNQLGTGVAARIAPVPLVQVTEPYKGQDLAGYSSITLRWKERYARWDGARYTEKYPCVDANMPPCTAVGVGGNPALEWHDDSTLVFNVKYSMDGGGTWYSALTDDPAKPGEYLAGGDSIAYSATHLYTYAWDVSALASGTKLVRVESYRNGLPLHYAYHEISFETNP